MIKYSVYSSKQFITWITFLIVVLGGATSFSQVQKAFSKRADFNVQGDFMMIGNTNLTLNNYTENRGNGNEVMKYVDKDNDPTTINSSSATLVLPNSDCQTIVYAGLYWSGRAHNERSPDSFTVKKDKHTFQSIQYNNEKCSYQSYFKEVDYRFNAVEWQGEKEWVSFLLWGFWKYSNAYPRYQITSDYGVQYQFELTNNTSNPVHYRIGTSGQFQPLASTYNTATGVATLETPFLIEENQVELQITGFVRDSQTTIQDFGPAARIVYNVVGSKWKPNGQIEDITLNKRKVKLKVVGDQYHQVEADRDDIYYPNKIHGNMYAAYADVTDYVREKGAGEYFVADMALQEGDGGSTGYYGGWGMIVIYEKPGMTRRSIAVFDGHAYVAGSVVSSYELPITGFRAVQSGNAKVTIGMMAGEGDVDIKGDYFDIRNATNTTWKRINRIDGQTVDAPNDNSDRGVNFFNSSITTGGNQRNPNLLNNTGLDLARFELDNQHNTIIGNNQTTTKFRYGSRQDTFVIYNMVFAVDAYEPEVIGNNKAVALSDFTPIHNGVVQEGQELAFELDLYNKGSEAVIETTVEIPIPYNMHYVDATLNNQLEVTGTVAWIPPLGGGNNPATTAGGTLLWTIGELPLDETQTKRLGQLKYRLKTSNHCVLLATASCGNKIELNGVIKGKGMHSTISVHTPFVRNYSTDLCTSSTLDSFKLTLVPHPTFLQSCLPSVENGILYLKVGCSSLPSQPLNRAEVERNYPVGTKFFSTPPTAYESTTGLVVGDFTISPEGESMYYAVIPGMPNGCYATFVLEKEVITTKPTARDARFCLGSPLVLEHELSQTGIANAYELVYFNQEGMPLLEAPNPTEVGTYVYFVAEGKDGCYGEKVRFEITVDAAPILSDEEKTIELCENSDTAGYIEIPAQGTTFNWEYKTKGSTQWEVLQNTTFEGVIHLVDNKIKIEHAPLTIQGMQVRLKVRTGSCVLTSKAILIVVESCGGRTNPMLLSVNSQ